MSTARSSAPSNGSGSSSPTSRTCGRRTFPAVLDAASRGARLGGRLRQAFAARIDEQVGNLVGPVKQPCEPGHDRHATKTDQQLHRETMRVLNQDPVRPEGQEYAEAE